MTPRRSGPADVAGGEVPRPRGEAVPAAAGPGGSSHPATDPTLSAGDPDEWPPAGPATPPEAGTGRDAAASIRLGPFLLGSVLGRGGMGEVWSGRHVADGLPVAVKVLAAHRSGRTGTAAAFRNEVRAVAALDHASIVHVFEHGVVTPEAERSSGGGLVAGSPWLAMELASSGSIVPWAEGRRGPLSWPELRALLLRILDGLAHAHARGLLHLDIKPANILLCGPRDLRPGLKLSDFGLSRALELAPEEEFASDDTIAGTPMYMAPEQVESRSREFGPWTDLYSLGCVAFHLASCTAPFAGDDLLQLAWAHLVGERRELVPRMPVPAGFGAWVQRLADRDPARRFQRAADAGWALLQLPEPEEGVAGATTEMIEVLPDESLPFLAGAVTALPLSLERTERAGRGEASGAFAALGLPAGPSDAPPMPQDWRQPDRPAPPPRLVGAGLGLFGLRAVPVVAREAERDLLWSALGQVAAAGQPRWVLLEGPAGCGKSHLARWLCERAEETGAGRALRAVHNPVPGRGDGIGPMLCRHLRCDGLSYDRVLSRLSVTLAPRLARADRSLPALAEMLAPRRPAAHLFERPEERFVVARDLLALLAEDRPVILWLEDLQWGLEAATFADWLCGRAEPSPVPVLVLGTVRSEALVEREAERRVLSEARAASRAEAVSIGPLEPAFWPAMARAVLDLEPRLAHEVAERSQGSPLFAVQLVADLALQGMVEPSPRGYRLKDGAEIRLPPGPGQAWGARTERLLLGRADADGMALELAAVLGQDVDGAEWAQLCAAADVVPSADLVEVLLAARLAVCGPDGPARGWAFVHGVLRESLEDRAREKGRAERWHLLAARMLAETGGASPGRLGRHLLLGGACDEAATALLAAATEAKAEADPRQAVSLLGLWERAMARLGPSEDDPRTFEGQLLRVGLERSLADFAASVRWAGRARATAEQRGRDLDVGRAMTEEARTRVNLAEYGAAQELLDRAFPLLDDGAALAAAFRVQGLVSMSHGKLQEAQEVLERAVLAFVAAGDERQAGYCLVAIAQCHKQAGRIGASLAALEDAHLRFEKVGYRLGLGECANGLGELHRLRGALPEAERAYREALDLWEAVGSLDVPVVRANLGLVLSARGDFVAARRAFEEALRSFAADGRDDLVAAVHVIRLVPLAAAAMWEDFGRSLERARDLLDRTGFVYVDVAREAERAGDHAERRGETRLARAAREVALSQWEGLSRSEDADRVRARLAT